VGLQVLLKLVIFSCWFTVKLCENFENRERVGNTCAVRHRVYHLQYSTSVIPIIHRSAVTPNHPQQLTTSNTARPPGPLRTNGPYLQQLNKVIIRYMHLNTTHPHFCKDISSPPLTLMLLIILYCNIVPLTIYPTWWWPNEKGPKYVVGTHLYVTNTFVFLTDTLCVLVYLISNI
jgi:hypothetical protein